MIHPLFIEISNKRFEPTQSHGHEVVMFHGQKGRRHIGEPNTCTLIYFREQQRIFGKFYNVTPSTGLFQFMDLALNYWVAIMIIRRTLIIYDNRNLSI